MQDEGNLVRQAKQGDQKAFARLYEDCFDRIYRYVVLRIGDRTEAEDLTQQVFLNAYQSLPSFKWKGIPFAAWLFRIAHNQVVDHLRKKTRYAIIPVDVPECSSENDDPQLMAEFSLSMEQVASATRQLTESQREVISLRFAGGLSILEVAKIMGKSQGAIKALQHSAIVALRKALAAGSNE